MKSTTLTPIPTIGTKIRLTTRIKERAIGSIGIVTEVVDPTVIVKWEQELPGVLSWTELLPEFIEIISLPTLKSDNQESVASDNENPVIELNKLNKHNNSQNEEISLTLGAFDYQKLGSVGEQAQQIRTELILFARQTFTGLVKIGSKLWGIYEGLCNELGAKKGKKAFDNWLESPEFGGSRYLAQSAMQLSCWYESLPPALQRLVATKAHKWSIAALRQLPKLTNRIVEKLVTEGKQTAQSIRCATKIEIIPIKTTENATINDNTQIIATNPETVINNDINTPSNDNDKGEIVVIPSNDLVKQPLPTKHRGNPGFNQAKSVELYTPEQVEVKIAEAVSQAIADYERAQQERRLAMLVETREEALRQVQDEIKAVYEQNNREKAKYNQLLTKYNDLASAIKEAREFENERAQMQQRIEDLEKALRDATASQWKTTFTKEAEKVINKELAATIEPLSLRIEQLEQQLQQKESELTQKTEELKHYQALDVPLSNEQLFVGARVKIIACDKGWEGYTAVVNQRSNDSWWLKIDGDDSVIRHLYKATQLTWNLAPEPIKPKQLEPKAEFNQLEQELSTVKQSNQEFQQQIIELQSKLSDAQKVENLLNKRLSQVTEQLNHNRPANTSNASISQLIQIFNQKRIKGWSSSGYTNSKGEYYSNWIDAICSFVMDLMNQQYQPLLA